MRTRNGLLLVAAGLLLAVAAGCSDDSTGSPDLGTGALNLYYSDAPANVTVLNIRFIDFALYDTAGNRVALAMPEGTNAVNLIEAANNPTFLRQFNVPVGDYNGLEGSFEIVDFTADGNTCTVADPQVDIPRLTMQNSFIRVTDMTTYSLLVDIPVLTGNCPANGWVGTIGLGQITMRPHTGP